MIKDMQEQQARLKAAKQRDALRRRKKLAREEEIKNKDRASLKSAKAKDKKHGAKA